MFQTISTHSSRSISPLSMDIGEEERYGSSPLALQEKIIQFGEQYLTKMSQYIEGTETFVARWMSSPSPSLGEFKQIVRGSFKLHDDFILSQLGAWSTEIGITEEEAHDRIKAESLIYDFINGNGEANVLRLNFLKIESLPDSLFAHSAFQRMKILALLNTNIDRLPLTLGCLGDTLEQLFLRKGQLSQFPLILREISSLKCLDLAENQIMEIPPFINDLWRLETLYLERNFLSEVPDISGLTSLKKIYLSQNKISYIDPKIEECLNLNIISLDHNFLYDTPDLSKLGNLSVLTLQNNCLISIGDLPQNLEEIDISLNTDLVINNGFFPPRCRVIRIIEP